MTGRRSSWPAAVALLVAACSAGPRDGALPEPSVLPTVRTSPSPTASAGTGAPTARPSRDPASAYPRQRLSWRGCRNGFECATLRVPLDYTNPSGRRIAVSVIRLRASGGQGRRIGSLVINPGGPGGSGIDFARQARQLLPSGIRARFDVVSFDPRGVGASTPLDCVGNRELDRILAADPTPETAAEKRTLVAVSREQAEGCGRRSGELLRFVSTVDVARDLEVLRNALGDPKLTYVGFSYGTVLGARYAERFPDRIRALVLDGAVDLRVDRMEASLEQAKGFETALAAFLEWCETASACRFDTGDDAKRAFAALMERIDRSPLPAAQHRGRELGPSEALFGVAAGLYNRDWGWPALGEGLAEASDGDGSTLLTLFDGLVERRRDGSYTNATEALVAVSCVDGEYPRDLPAYDAAAARFRRVAPTFGEALAYGALPCAFWPVPAVSRAGPVRAPGTPPIVVVGTTRDPATPYRWSQALASQLPRGVLVTYDGDGHTAYGYDRSDCIERIVDAYLIDLRVPRRGARCR